MTDSPLTDVLSDDTTSGRSTDGRRTGSPTPGIPAGDKMIIAILLVAVFVVILNETIMGVALPRLMTALDIEASTGQWLSTAFMLTMAVVIPTTGFLLQRLTTRTVLVLAMTLFCVGALAAGLAPNFWLLLIARVVQGSGTAIMLPLLMTTSLPTGLLLLRGGLLMGILGPVVGRLFDRYGPRGLSVFGALMLVVSMWRFSAVDPETSIGMLLALHMGLSLGLACLFTPAFTTALNPLPPYLYSHGSAILSTLQQVAGAAGVALLVTIMAGRSQALIGRGVPQLLATNEGIQTAFLVAAIISAGAVVLAFTLKKTGAAEGVEPTH